MARIGTPAGARLLSACQRSYDNMTPDEDEEEERMLREYGPALRTLQTELAQAREDFSEQVKHTLAAEAEVERLLFGLETIMRCAGAPDPAGALHTVIELARKTLTAGRGEPEKEGGA